MARYKDYTNGSRRAMIIKALLMTGAIPRRSAVLFPWHSEMTRRLLNKMVEESVLVEKKSIKNRRFFALKALTREQIPTEIASQIPEVYLDYYESIGSDLRVKAMSRDSTGNVQERALNSSDAYLFFKGIDAECDPDEKPFLLGDTDGIAERQCYYFSREVKSVPGLYMDRVKEGKDESGRVNKQVFVSRVNGVYLSGTGLNYMVYDIGTHSIYWMKNAESNMIRHTEYILYQLGFKEHSIHGAVFLYRGTSVLTTIFNQVNKPGTYRGKLSIDFLYNHMYVLPSTKEGQRLMRVMSKENWEYRFRKLFLSDDAIKNGDSEFDGLERGDTLTIYDIFCIPDIAKLKRFLAQAKAKKETDRFIIYAFTFQREFLEQICDKSNVTVKYADFTEFESKFLLDFDKR